MSASVRVGFHGPPSYQQILKELLSPWDVSFSTVEQADVVVVYDCEVSCEKKLVIIPHEKPDFHKWVNKQNLRVINSHQRLVRVDVSERNCLTIWPQELYEYEPLQTSRINGSSSAGFLLNDQVLTLTLDIFKEFVGIVSPALLGKPSKIYSLLTGLPIKYDVAPKSFRDFFMRNRKDVKVINFNEKLPLDALRFTLVKAIERLLGKKILQKKWNGASNCCLITHDMDTEQGLRRANSVRKLEEKYNLQSAWYIPTKHFSLDNEIVKELANNGEVGVHGAKHAENMIRLSSQELFSQVWEAKQTLEKISHSAIYGFRSPLLQHNSLLLDNLKRAGYAYDTSIPTWEPRHPQTMSSFGIGTVFPLNLNGLIEIPVSIIQDHQLLYVLGFRPKETVKQWLSFMDTIKEIGGCNVLLSHPEYKLFDSENLSNYEDFLSAATSDKESLFTTPSCILRRINSARAHGGLAG